MTLLLEFCNEKYPYCISFNYLLINVYDLKDS